MRKKSVLASLLAITTCSSTAPLISSCSSESNDNIKNPPIDSSNVDDNSNSWNDDVKPLPDIPLEEIQSMEYQAKKYISEIKSNKFDKEDIKKQLNNYLFKINSVIRSKEEKLITIKQELHNDPNTDLTYQLNKFESVFTDKSFFVNDRETLKQIDVETFLSESRYLNEGTEAYRQRYVGELNSFWNDTTPNHNDAKINVMLSIFLKLDNFKEFYYELLVLPAIFEEVYGIKIGVYARNNPNNIEVNNIVRLLNSWKTIDLCRRHLKYTELSPTTKNSFWYKWCKSVDFNNVYKDSNAWLDNQKYEISDSPIINNEKLEYFESALPKYIDKNDHEKIFAYVDEIATKIKTEIFNQNGNIVDKNQLILIEEYTDKIFNRINYIYLENEYKKKYLLNDIDLNNNFEEFKSKYNASLFNKDLMINSDLELKNIYVDMQKTAGLNVINFNINPKYEIDSSLGDDGTITPETILKDIAIHESNYEASIKENNLFRKVIFNNYVREADKFKELLFEFSIFPYLIWALTGTNYDQWSQSNNNNSGYKYEKYNKNWMMHQYLIYRTLNYDIYNTFKKASSLQYEELRGLRETTKNSNFYLWISSINEFDRHYQAFTGVFLER